MKRCITAISASFVLALTAGVATANAGLPMPEQVAAPSLNEASGGNSAEDSIGTVQVSGVSVDADVEASSDLLDTSADMDDSLSIAGNGGNEATDSIGTVQVGGGNTADDSIGTVQSGPISNDFSVEVSSEALDTSVDADVPLSIGGNGGNSATDSIGTVQLGGGNTADDSIGTVQSGPVSSNPSVDASSDLLDLDLQADAPLSIGGSGGNTATDSIGTVQLGGGNTADDSIGTVQSGPVSASPSLDASTSVLDVELQADTPLSIGGSGGNSASDSIGTVQLGGGNTASDSIGTVQSGPISLNPSVDASSDLLDLDLQADAPLSVGGSGGNTASDSIGTVQLGGGNRASDSIGTVQSGPISASPSVDASTSLLDIVLQADAPLSVGGSGGNTASDSIGTVQVGGGNVAEDSIGTVQVGGPVSAGPSGSVASDVVDVAVGGPVVIGGNGGNTATDSIGTVQIGGGNTATDSIGTVQIGGATGGSPTPSDPPAPPASAPPAPPAAGEPGHLGSGQDSRVTESSNESGQQAEAGQQSKSGQQGQAGQQSEAGQQAGPQVPSGAAAGNAGATKGTTSQSKPAQAVTSQTGAPASQAPEADVPPVIATSGVLPFTGLPLWLTLLLALAVLGSGLWARRMGSGARN